MQNKRIYWVDLLKLFAAFLMTWGHSIMHMGLTKQDYYLLYNSGWIYTFHMPLFMILSGFVSYKLFEGNINIQRKFEQLIIPCFIVYSIQVIIPDTNNLWYLKSLFACYIIWAQIYRTAKKYGFLKSSFFILLICFIFFPILVKIPIVNTWKIDFMLPFFGLGIFFHYKINFIKNNLFKISLVSLCFFTLLLLLYEPNWVWYFSKPNWISVKINKEFTLADMLIIKKHLINLNWLTIYDKIDFTMFSIIWSSSSLIYYFSRFLVGVSGSLFFICISIIINNKLGDKIEKISKWGYYSMHVYILQNILFIICEKINLQFPLDNIYLYSFLYCPILAFLLTAIYIFTSRLLEKNYYINRYIFGKV